MNERLRPALENEPASRSGLASARIEGMFRTLTDGRRVFCPMGALARIGYVIQSPDQEFVLKTRIREPRWSWVMFLWILIYTLSMSGDARSMQKWDYGIWIALYAAIFLIGFLYEHFRHWRVTRSMGRIRVPMSAISIWRSAGRREHPALLALRGLFLFGFSGWSLYIYITTMQAGGLCLFLVMGLLFVPWAVSLHGRWLARGAR